MHASVHMCALCTHPYTYSTYTVQGICRPACIFNTYKQKFIYYILYIMHTVQEESILRPNSRTKSRQKSYEFSSLLFTVTSTALPWDLYFFKLTQPRTVSVKEKGGKPDRKLYPLPYGLRCRNLKSENSQDYGQKPHLNCTFMNSASGVLSTSEEFRGLFIGIASSSLPVSLITTKTTLEPFRARPFMERDR